RRDNARVNPSVESATMRIAKASRFAVGVALAACAGERASAVSPTRIRSTSTRSLRGLVALSLVLLANGAGPGAGPVAASALDPPTTTLADSTPPLGSVELPPAPGDSSLQATPDPLALRGDGRPRPTTASWKAAKAGVSDLFYLYTTPLRMSGLNVLETGAVLGTGVALYSVDGEIESGFRRSRENGVYRTLVIDAGGALEPLGLVARTNGWLAGAAVAGWVFDVPLLRTIPVEMIESNLIVGALRQPLQRLSRRSRPSDDAGSHSFGGGQSFPSGHSSVVCEYAAILSHHFRRPAARASIWS